MEKIKRSEFIKIVAKDLKIPVKAALVFEDSYFWALSEQLKAGKSVMIPKIGLFFMRGYNKTKSNKGLREGKYIESTCKIKRKISFKPARKLKLKLCY